FYQEGLVPLEPFGFFPSAKFRPLVTYDYFTDAGGPTLESLTVAQRLHFDPKNANDPSDKFVANATMLSCDADFRKSGITCKPSVLNDLNVVGMLHNQNPLQHAEYKT